MQALLKVLFGLLLAVETAAAAPVDEAKALFNSYVQREHAFDPALADLYADDAVIRHKRLYPTGEVRVVTLPTVQYKALIRQAMPLAKSRGDTSEYSQVGYQAEAAGIRIQASRFSHLKHYTSPISLFVAPDRSGQWLIFEEVSESRP